jgi:hypothetical protein
MKRIIRAVEFGPGREDIDGLAECLLRDLDSIVILSGTNGSGKTRIINAIKSKLDWVVEQGTSLGDGPNGYWEYWHDNKKTLRELAAKDPQELSSGQRRELDRLRKELASCPAFKFDPSLNPENIKVLQLFAPQEPNFRDPIELSDGRRRQLREQLNGSKNLLLESESSLEYLDTIVRLHRVDIRAFIWRRRTNASSQRPISKGGASAPGSSRYLTQFSRVRSYTRRLSLNSCC